RRTPNRHPHPGFLDRHLADSSLLDDPNELTDPLGARLVDAAEDELSLAGRATADRPQERLGFVAEQPEQKELLFARREAGGAFAHLLERRGRGLVGVRVREP